MEFLIVFGNSPRRTTNSILALTSHFHSSVPSLIPLLIVSFFMMLCRPLSLAQSNVQTGQDPVSVADGLLKEGKIDAALQLLTTYLVSHPNDPEALRLLGRAYYWSGRPDDARQWYEQAHALAPHNVGLQLEYARMLAETGGSDRAKGILIPLTLRGAASAEALELLGTIQYWEGDWTEARDSFVEALARDPGNREARRQLNEIAVATASFASFGLEYQDDTQPLRRSILTGELDLQITPLQRFHFQVQPLFATVSDTARSVFAASAAWKQYAPTSKLEMELSAGLLKRSFAKTADWTWGVILGLRLPNHTVLRANVERLASLYASASFSTPVMTTSGGLQLAWNHPNGRMGRVAAEIIRFPDDNVLRRFSGWFLFPLGPPAGFRVSAGYGYTAQHAEENRFTQVGDPSSTSGMYIPYYTPTSLQAHSVLGAVHIRLSAGTEFQLNGSYGFMAKEDAPSFLVDSIPPQRTTIDRVFLERSFHPSTVKATLTVRVDSYGTLLLEGVHSSNSFYDLTQVNLRFSYRFLPSDHE